MPATVNVHRLTTVSSFDCFSDSTAFEDISEPVFPIPEEHFRFPDHSELPGLANSNTQIPGNHTTSCFYQTFHCNL